MLYKSLLLSKKFLYVLINAAIQLNHMRYDRAVQLKNRRMCRSAMACNKALLRYTAALAKAENQRDREVQVAEEMCRVARQKFTKRQAYLDSQIIKLGAL